MSSCEQCIVRELSALKALTKDELIKISNCRTSKIIKKGEIIFEEGKVLQGVFCIKDGVCKLTKKSANGKDQTVRLVTKGDLLGQRSLISHETTNLSAVAVDDMKVCFVPKDDVLNFLDNNKKFTMNILKTAFSDLRETDIQLVNMAQKTAKARLACTLLYLEENFGVLADNTLKIQLSRDEIASIIGTATESCIRLLSEFNKLGLIEISGKKISLTDKRKLQIFAA